MLPVVFSPAARDDLVGIWDYIASDDANAADRFVEEIEGACRRFGAMPGMGHSRDDLTAADVRFWPVRSYLLVYRLRTDCVEVVRILSGYRDIVALLSDVP